MLQQFSLDLAQYLYNSTEQFPVNFDDAWQWLEYTRKDNAKRALEKNFVEGEDYHILNLEDVVKRPQGGGTQPLDIFLTVNCFKELGMMAGTEKGREVRRYFIRCEQTLKELLRSQSEPRQIEPLKRETQAQLLLALADSVKRKPNDRAEITLQAHLTNLIEAAQQSDPVPQLLSVTEVCEMHGIYLPKGKDSVVGRKVAAEWRSVHDQQDPPICAKHVGSGHRTADIKVYPTDFFERIIAIAEEYLQ